MKKEKKINPMTRILNSINQKKEYLENEEDSTQIGGFVITRILSQREDLILICNEINKYAPISKSAIYKFYYNVIPKNRKFAKKAVWDVNPNIDVVMEHFKVNKRIATDYLNVMTKEDIDFITQKQFKGGKG